MLISPIFTDSTQSNSNNSPNHPLLAAFNEWIKLPEKN
jgi:hypothetical protein